MKELLKVKLGELVDFQTGPFGTQFSASEYVEEGIPVINVKNIGVGEVISENLDYISEATRDRLSQHILQEGDIVFGRKGSVDRHAYIMEKEDGWVQGSDCIRARRKAKINTLFLSQYLESKSVKKQIMDSAVGSTMPSLNTDILRDIFVLLPTAEEQDSIAFMLKKVSDKISLNKKINDNLQQQAMLLFDYWFTQFDFPDSNENPYHSSGGKLVWNNQLKKNIPLGWEVKPLSSICEICLGGTPSTTMSEYWNGSIAWLNSGEVAQFPVVSSEKKITQLGMENSPAKLMNKNTTIVSITGNIRASILAIDACANQSVVGILETETFKSPFIYQNMLRLLNYYTSISTGNCQKHISKGAIEESLVCIPDSSTLKKYYTLAEPLYKQMHEIALENQHLTSLRDWLLPMLMNGQATISE